jgi:hypothetical protein
MDFLLRRWENYFGWRGHKNKIDKRVKKVSILTKDSNVYLYRFSGICGKVGKIKEIIRTNFPKDVNAEEIFLKRFLQL